MFDRYDKSTYIEEFDEVRIVYELIAKNKKITKEQLMQLDNQSLEVAKDHAQQYSRSSSEKDRDNYYQEYIRSTTLINRLSELKSQKKEVTFI